MPKYKGPMPEEEVQKQLKILEASYKMYDSSIRETKRRLKTVLNQDGSKRYTEDEINKQVQLVVNAQNDIMQQYEYYGGDPNKLKPSKVASVNRELTMSAEEMIRNMGEEHAEREALPAEEVSRPSTMETPQYEPTIPDVMASPSADAVQFDLIPLPSNGEVYKNKVSKVKVAYLTAYDENLIVSPNLYRDGLVIDYLLKNKILDDVNPMYLTQGDRNAIILWLRATGYGPNYPITATDDVTGQQFETNVDLSQLKYKPFELKSDENGFFPYTLPVSKKEVKFRFLTYMDEKNLEMVEKTETPLLKKDRLRNIITDLNFFTDSDRKLGKEKKTKIYEGIRALENWIDDLEGEAEMQFTRNLTNRMELQVMSVDGNTNKEFIRNFVRNMSAADSYALRKYINDNEPGVDFNIKIEKPESLGGGSMEVFLSLDQFVFLNTPK